MHQAFIAGLLIVVSASAALADAKDDCVKKSGDVAIVACTEAIRLNPKDAASYVNRSFEYLQKDEYDRAIADTTKAIELAPKGALACNNRSFAYQ